MTHTANFHILGPDVNVRAVRHATGRISVQIEDGQDLAVTMTVASQQGDDGLFSDPVQLAAQLEVAARQLRTWCRPIDAGDHFIRPDEAAAHDAAESAALDGTDAPLALAYDPSEGVSFDPPMYLRASR